MPLLSLCVHSLFAAIGSATVSFTSPSFYASCIPLLSPICVLLAVCRVYVGSAVTVAKQTELFEKTRVRIVYADGQRIEYKVCGRRTGNVTCRMAHGGCMDSIRGGGRLQLSIG